MAAAPAVLVRSPVRSAPQASLKAASARSAAPRGRADAVPANALSRRLSGALPFGVQTQLKVSSAADPAEKEADSTARAVMRMESPTPRNVPSPTPIQRSALAVVLPRPGLAQAAPLVQRKPAGPAKAEPDVEADIRASLGGGVPLPPKVRQFMEPRFRADFGAVRIHTDAKAAGLSSRLGARAFAFGKDIFFGRGEFRPDTPAGAELIAHELTHTIQQRAVVQRQAAANVTQTAPVQVQRLGIDTVLDFIADKANVIPGFRMFTIVLGVNPINMSAVEASPANVLRAVIEFIPGGGLVTQALDSSGVFEKVANWAAQQIKSLGMAGSAIKKALMDFLKSLGFTDLARPGSVWERAKSIFTGPIDRIKNFVKGFVTGIVQFVKDAILIPIAKLAAKTPGYDLLKGVMGKDPITGEPAADSAELLIGGFMKLIGQQEVWENIKKSGAIPKAWAWFKGALSGLKAFVLQIPATFIAAFKALELADIVLVPRAFGKLAGVFGAFLGRFISWAGNAVWNLLEIIFSVVAPGALGYIKRTGAALKSILKNPLPFVGKLVKAAKLGFQNFADRIGTHLKKGLIDWLTGSLSGVYIPKALSLGEIVKFVFSVLGLTWANLRGKLVKAVGETAVGVMEKTFGIVVTLKDKGPAAAWDQIKDELAALKDKVVEGIKDLVINAVVTKAIPKLLAMFIPGAGFISAIVAIYDTVMVFVQKISKIIQVVTAFIDSIVAIAGGAITAAANKVESVLAGLLSLAINFLAGFAGLGKIASKINEVIEKIRAPIDKALESIAAWIKKMAQKFLAKAKGALTQWWKARKPVESSDGEKHTLYMEGQGARAKLIIRSDPTPYRDFVKSLDTKKDKAPALTLADRMDAAIAAAAKENAPATAGEVIEKTLAELAAATVPLLGGAKEESTPPVFGSLVGGYGSSATVLRLTSKFKKGGEPRVEDGTWAVLRKRLDGKGTYYVRGHLLNHNLGGPGNTWTNLTPLTQNANNRANDSMLKLFEKPIKEATKKGKAISFSVTVTYGRSHPLASNADSYITSGDEEWAKIGEIIKAEKYVPVSLICKGSQIDANGKVGSAVAQMSVDNVIQDRFEDYFLNKEAKKPLNINTASAEDLLKLYGIDQATAQAIAAKRPYASWEAVMKAGSLTAEQWKAARETPRLRVVLKL